MARTRFRLLRFRSPLLTEYLFLRVLRCFSSPGALYPAYVFSRECLGITPGGFPHSDTAGSSFASNSPALIAGSRVLLRHLVPRHPPWTLSSLPCLHPLFSRRTTHQAGLVGYPAKSGSGDEESKSSSRQSTRISNSTYSVDNVLVEMTGLEPVTPCVQSRCSPS